MPTGGQGSCCKQRKGERRMYKWQRGKEKANRGHNSGSMLEQAYGRQRVCILSKGLSSRPLKSGAEPNRAKRWELEMEKEAELLGRAGPCSAERCEVVQFGCRPLPSWWDWGDWSWTAEQSRAMGERKREEGAMPQRPESRKQWTRRQKGAGEQGAVAEAQRRP